MTTTRRAPWVGLLVLAVGGLGVLVFRVLSPANIVVTFRGPTMGTTWTVRVAADVPRDEQLAIQTAIAAELERVDASMSTWRSDSELSLLNASRVTEPQAASEDLLAVLALSERVSRASDGAFDVTVGPLVDAWGFGPGRSERDFAPPEAARLEALRTSTGYELLAVDTAAGTAAKAHPELRIDLSAVAKGYAVDLVAAALEARGLGDFIVEIGGEVVARGDRFGESWRVGIEWPEPGPRRLWGEVHLGDAALATSGSYHNLIEFEGQTYSHTIDPRTGRPVPHALVSVSVLAETCAQADAWATALTVLGEEAGFELASELGLAALFIWRGRGGDLEARSTGTFEQHLAERSQ